MPGTRSASSSVSDPAPPPDAGRSVTPAAVALRRLVKEFPDARNGTVVRAVDEVSLTIDDGEFFALLGPSGCGKTTTLRAIAGFEAPSSGEILLRGQAVQGVPAFHRPVNTVFQDYALFPHMSVLHNVAFGLRMARIPRAEAHRQAREALAMVQLESTADRRPHQLSGGQRQRVALARALVNRPAVLLLDEPLGALDLKLRKAMQLELKELQREVGITFVYVTHDQEEALTMADRIAVMDRGRVLQIGRPDDIYERPTSRFVADFIGETNFLAGSLEARDGERGRVVLAGGRRLAATIRGDDLQPGAEVVVAVRPEKIELRDAGAEAPVGTTALPATVREIHYLGTDTRVHVALDDGTPVVVRIQNGSRGLERRPASGERVEVTWLDRHASVLR